MGRDRGDRRPRIRPRGPPARQFLDALGGDTLTRAELEETLGDAREWKSTLDALVGEGVVGRSGEGKRGDPHRFRRILWDRPPQKTTETLTDAVAASVVVPPLRGNHRNATSRTAPTESCDGAAPTETKRALPRAQQVWAYRADLLGHRVRVLAVDDAEARLRIESSNGDAGREVAVPLTAFGGSGLRRLA